MTRVIAFSDGSTLAAPVIETARTVARLLGDTVDVVRAVDDTAAETGPREGAVPGEPAWASIHRTVVGPIEQTLVDQLAAEDVSFGVIGSRTLASKPDLLGHVSAFLVTAAEAPLIVVPPTGRSLTGDDLLFLLPLDGDPATSESSVPIVHQLTERMGRVITMHVFDSTSAPMFITSAEDRAVIAEEFAARHASHVGGSPELRLGRPADEILDVARAADVDAVVLCWRQDLAVGRAQVVRRLLLDGKIPLILQPMPAAADTPAADDRPASQ